MAVSYENEILGDEINLPSFLGIDDEVRSAGSSYFVLVYIEHEYE